MSALRAASRTPKQCVPTVLIRTSGAPRPDRPTSKATFDHRCTYVSESELRLTQVGPTTKASVFGEDGVVEGAEGAVDPIRERIIAERRRLQSLVESLTANFDDLTNAADASPPDDEHDPEGHTIAFERSQLASRRDEYLRSIADLTAAEARLADAASALCERCGDPIPMERRLALPATTTCVACATPSAPRRLRSDK